MYYNNKTCNVCQSHKITKISSCCIRTITNLRFYSTLTNSVYVWILKTQSYSQGKNNNKFYLKIKEDNLEELGVELLLRHDCKLTY